MFDSFTDLFPILAIQNTTISTDSNGDDEFDMRLIGDSIGVPAVVVMMSFWRCVFGDSERFRRWFPASRKVKLCLLDYVLMGRTYAGLIRIKFSLGL